MPALFLAVLACETPAIPEPVCHHNTVTSRDPACPCADAVYRANALSGVVCRPDQQLRVEWEPQPVGDRGENEDRVGALVVCECVP
jgi:hypothetical protein